MTPCLMVGPVTHRQLAGHPDEGVGFVEFLPLIAAAFGAGTQALAARKAAQQARDAQNAQNAADAKAQANALEIAKINAAAGSSGVGIPGLGSISPATLAMLGGAVALTFLLVRSSRR